MSNTLSFLKSKQFWKELVIMTLGLLAGAAAIYYFLIPSKIIVGTISGVAIIISDLLARIGVNLKVSLLVFILNAILLVLAYVMLGKEIGTKTVFASLLIGPFMELWEWIYPYENFLTDPGQYSVMNDPWLDLCCFVLLLGVSQAFLFRINASTGGLDVIALILNRRAHMEIGTSVTVAGGVICLTAFAINPFKMVVVGLIGTWINGLVVDYFTATLNKRKRVCIISKEHEKVRKYIIEELVRGCSLYPVKGGYSGEDGIEIQALLTQHEFASLMEYVRKENIRAFITAGNCSEVYGFWLPHSAQKKLRHHEK